MTQHDKIQDLRLDGLEEGIRQQTKLRMKVVLPLIKFAEELGR